MSNGEMVKAELSGALTGISVQAVLDRLRLINELMSAAMIKDIDYGVIPGTKGKPTLLKPGAEKLAVMFRLAPRYKTEKHFHADGHLTVESTCQILDANENFLGEASAMCSTRESKYRYRGGARVCPECGKPNIRKSNKPPRNDPEGEPGFYCWAKTGGCGANFDAGDERITSQSEQKVENPDLADSYNTVLRIAEKRSLLGAIRLVTGSSALFDEEIPGSTERDDAEPPPRRPAPPKKTEPLPEDPAVTKARALWTERMASDPPLDLVNGTFLPEIRAMSEVAARMVAWGVVKAALEKDGAYAFSAEKKEFVPVTTDGSEIPF